MAGVMGSLSGGRARMTDVARLAGVSSTTVSFVLAGRDEMRISEATRQKVLRAARELNYRPNAMARGLRTGETRTIGLVTDAVLTEQYAADLVRGCLLAAGERGHVVVVAESPPDPAAVTAHLQDILSGHLDGVVYASHWTKKVKLPRAAAGARIVLLNCLAGRGQAAIVPDETQGGWDAARILLDAGHDSGVYLVGESPEGVLAAQERVDGMGAALAAAGTQLAGQVDCNWWPESAYERVSQFLAGGGRPTALICLSDHIAMGAYQALADAGLRVPADVSVVAFDDSPLASWLRPQVTSVALPFLQMGRQAVETLLGEERAAGIRRVRMPVRHRQSVAPPARGPVGAREVTAPMGEDERESR